MKFQRAITLSVLLGVISPLFAAEPVDDERLAPGETIQDRAHPEFDPLGVRAGTFMLYPQVKLEARYDDNVYYSPNKLDDWATVLSPSLLVVSDWSRHLLRIDVGSDVTRYDTYSREDGERTWLNVDGRIDVTSHTVVTLNGEVVDDSESRGSPDDIDGLDRAETSRRALRIGIEHRPGRFFAAADAQFEALDFGDVWTSAGTLINNDDRDRDERTASLTLGYEMTPEYDAFIRYTRGERDYDDLVDDAGFNRNSSSNRLMIGADLDLSGVLVGEVSIGALEYSYDDPRFDDVDDFAANALLYWHVTPLTTITFQVERSVAETTAATSSGYTSDVYAVAVYHELLRNLVLQSSLSSVTNQYESIGRQDDLITFKISGEYEANRNLFFGAGYEYGSRDSNVVGVDYDRNVVSAWVGLRL